VANNARIRQKTLGYFEFTKQVIHNRRRVMIGSRNIDRVQLTVHKNELLEQIGMKKLKTRYRMIEFFVEREIEALHVTDTRISDHLALRIY